MFRYRSQAIFVVVAVLGLFCAPGRSDPLIDENLTITGIDVYESTKPDPLAGKRVGLITNQTGLDSAGTRTIDVLAGRKDVKLVAIFSPEHGIDGSVDSSFADTRDAKTELRIYSLYGATRRPTDDMLHGIDVLVFDIQDAGVRFYTYVTTMAYCMEAAAKHRVPFFVFDRPDPLGGEVIEGPMLDPDRTSFTGYFSMPVRYAMTMGELAKMFNAENKIGADLTVVPLQNWERRDMYDQTTLKWTPPSPNLRTVDAAILYPGIEVLQAGGISVGRGTDKPFEVLGAPWIDAAKFAAALDRRNVPGVSFAPLWFVPNEGVYKGETCKGVWVFITKRSALESMRMGLEIADVLHQMYPDNFDLDKVIDLLGSQSTIKSLKRGDAPAEIVSSWSTDIGTFRVMREKYLLYK